jgi:hypothetical protein
VRDGRVNGRHFEVLRQGPRVGILGPRLYTDLEEQAFARTPCRFPAQASVPVLSDRGRPSRFDISGRAIADP